MLDCCNMVGLLFMLAAVPSRAAASVEVLPCTPLSPCLARHKPRAGPLTLMPPAPLPGPPTPPAAVFEAELADHIPVIKTSVAGTRLVGRMTVGNRNGLLLPNTTTDQGAGRGGRGSLEGGGAVCRAEQLVPTMLMNHLCIASRHTTRRSPIGLQPSRTSCSHAPRPPTPAAAELMHIRNSLPDEVVVQRIDERLSALGNCIACNDYVALIHPDIDKVGG